MPMPPALAMLEIFCFGSGMTCTAQIPIDPLTPRLSRTRVEYQEIQHFSAGRPGEARW
ncbi:hypothetical protein J2W22_000007 [Sphingomonas kyeonggiensis]|nr:hypothetical protein [Sphingomonas kyeonggiensis]